LSNLEAAPALVACGGSGPGEPELLVGREVVLGGTRGMAVTRTLPHRDRRMVGAWCFVDRYGPADVTGRPGMRVPPHPHTGLQTVSWLLAGDILHRDSLGNEQLVEPGQLNLMTAGRGIAHAEESPPGHGPVLDGVQLWVALPAADRAVPPDFAHHADLPVLAYPGGSVTVIIGELAGVVSPARAYTPLVGAEIRLDGELTVPVRPDFEHAVLVLAGSAEVDDRELAAGPLLYLGTGRTGLRLAGTGRLLLLGGEPFEEQIVMWWNFIGGDHQDIVAARADWAGGDARFGVVHGYAGEALAAPVLPATTLKPRGRHR
jgi:redox-sensitive bicupin YhaK (pirin superfamily)